MNEKLLVPDIGDFEEVEIIEILVKEGDKISKNDPVITLESDKSSVEVPSTFEGIIDNINIKIGDKVSKGDLILTLSSENGAQQKQEVNEKIPPATEKIIAEAETSNGYKNSELDTNQREEIIEENSKLDASNEKSEIVVSNNDIDPLETKEWLESLSAVVHTEGPERAHFLIKQLIDQAYKEGSNIPYNQNTPYINTIPSDEEIKSPGDQNIERKIRALIRWNSAVMVVRANMRDPSLGGHIGTFASAATLYDIGMNHFWRAKNNKFGGDLIYFQGHSAPVIYARAFLE